MEWAAERRRAADRRGLRHPSDLTDAEWTPVVPPIRPAATRGKVVGRKHHLLTDAIGLLLGVVVHPAKAQDRDGCRARRGGNSRTMCRTFPVRP
ncbi:transposase [Neoroseomonas soli]|uniref:transposase n=1 Tax=Neoroseomonas soli TaxID=1081025 RepID=UPI0038CF88D9